jgi:hypothetical protein
LDLYWCSLGFDLIKSWLLVNNWYKSRLDQIVAHSFGTWSVLWNWLLIHIYESDLVNSWLLVNNWHKLWLDQVVAHSFGTWSALKAKSHWDFWWLAVSKYWFDINTVLCYTWIVLLQLLGFDLGFFPWVSPLDLSGVNTHIYMSKWYF